MSIFNHELDDLLKEKIEEYNKSYNEFCSSGETLHKNREYGLNVIDDVIVLVNSIAKHPKIYDVIIGEIRVERAKFIEAAEFVAKQVSDVKKGAIGIAEGAVGGIGVAALAPSAMMWIATTFGTASTGTAIAALSGAAATNAALAWLGGGALAVGGGGIAGGTAFLALAGPVGWGIGGAAIVINVALFVKKQFDSDKQKKEEIEKVIDNIAKINKCKYEIENLNVRCTEMTKKIKEIFDLLVNLKGKEYSDIDINEQYKLGELVNNTKILAYTISQNIEQ